MAGCLAKVTTARNSTPQGCLSSTPVADSRLKVNLRQVLNGDEDPLVTAETELPLTDDGRSGDGMGTS
jgi:hypothetical protein